MKRRPPPIDLDFTGVRLFLDDVEKILATMVEIAPKGVTIQTDEYEYESLDELRTNEDRPAKIVLSSYEPHMNFTVSKSDASLLAYRPDLVVTGAATRIEEIIRSRKTWRRTVLSRTYFSMAIAAIGVANVAAYYHFHGRGGIRSWWVQVLVQGTVWVSFISVLVVSRSPAIILLRKSQVPSFFKRNRDALLVGALLSLVGAAAGSLVTYALTRP